MTGPTVARMTVDEPRITDLSVLGLEEFKAVNQTFLDGDSRYESLPHQTDGELRRRIWNVRNGNLRRVLEDFPTDDPLVDQCANLMHAVAGRHFFPDANHRTAIVLLRRLLRQNGIDPGDWSIERTERVRRESQGGRKDIRPVRLDTLYVRDALFDVWRDYFEDVFAERRQE